MCGGDLAVRLVGGSQEFELFKKEFSEYAGAVKVAQDAKNLETPIAATHKLHAALCYIGVPRLKEITGEMERASRASKEITKIERHYQQLLKARMASKGMSQSLQTEHLASATEYSLFHFISVGSIYLNRALSINEQKQSN